MKDWIVLSSVLFLFNTIHSQEIYLLPGQLAILGNNFTTLLKYDAQICELQEVFEFKDELKTSLISPVSLSFHPDGRLYMISDNRLIAFNVLTRKIEKKLPLISIDKQPITLNEDLAYLAISEEGRILITEDLSGSEFINQFRYIDYNVRQNQSIRYYTSEDLFGLTDLNLPIGGFLKNDNFLFFGEGGSPDNKYPWDENSYSYWDVDAAKYDTVLLHHTKGYYFFTPSVYLPPCESPQMLATGSYNGLRNHEIIHINSEERSIAEICPGQLLPDITFPNAFWLFNGVANTTDFRQSPLRIDLDANNSSFHATAGYYDTLTTCRQEAPVTDDDITISTCGAEVDFISFRLPYYDQPRLPEEYLTAEGYEDDFKQVSPSRWEWHNPYPDGQAGGDNERIKEFLRSLRYHADWNPEDPNESRERVVITTMHVGEDSTSSWTVYQLEQDEVYAGRDTLVEYCPNSASLDLRSYLSEDALSGGHFEPEPSGGNGLFIPGTDEDDEYLYIVESGGCSDTAILTVQDILVSDPGLDTVYLCPGERLRIGFPPGKFSDIRWWDGSPGDSIWVQEAVDVTRQVNVTYDDKCGINITVHILIREVKGLAGRDTTLSYCPAGPEIDLSTFLPEPPGSSTSLEPSLQNGNLVFAPGTDPPGTYQYIVNAGGCLDTALITLEESATQDLPFDDVRLCANEDVSIGLPSGPDGPVPGEYENVMWWNGETEDSTTLTSSEPGPFWVEAQQNGCSFRADFDVLIQDAFKFPYDYFDTIVLCPDQHRTVIVRELDSIELDGRIYLSGEQIVFFDSGEFTLTGYLGGCSTSKTITIISIPDPSSAFNETIFWCEGTPLVLTLPSDSAGLIFSWSDGTVSHERPITATGEYLINIQSSHCTFQSKYTVIQNEGTECGDTEKCVISIPNAVTPNGDGQNDGLEIILTPTCGSVESVTLWDKWGGVIFSTREPRIGQGVWEQFSPGLYMVKVVYKDKDGKVQVEAGSVLVLK